MLDYSYEIMAHENGYKVVCGIDEAGRGPLAGPVFAAGVILPENYSHPVLNDSKKLSEKKRDAVYDDIIKDAISYSVGIATEEEIDEINILNATFLAMKRAVDGLNIKPDFAYIDGNQYPKTGVKEETIVKGDGKYLSIAAASILAKTYRDDYMCRLHEEYPHYGWDHNAGYPTREHREGIRLHGLTPYHRRSFNQLGDGQLSLFPDEA